MSDVILHSAGANNATRVSNVFIDHYMRDANGEYIKVYLYLLRCLEDEGKEFSIAGMADVLDHTQRDISRALSHWEKKGLLHLEFAEDGSLGGICISEPVVPRTQAPAEPFLKIASDGAGNAEAFGAAGDGAASVARTFEPTVDGAASAARAFEPTVDGAASAARAFKPTVDGAANVVSIDQGRRNAIRGAVGHSYSADEMSLLGQNEDVREMLCVTERYMGRPLASVESDMVLYWYDGMGMSADLIVYLVEYCLEHGHKSIHYMNKVAISWVDKGVSTVEEAREQTESFDSKSSVVAVEFGISDRGLVPTERAYLQKWQSEYGFSKELIGEACRRTILKTGRPNFQYADSILKSWKEAGAFSMDEVKRLDESHSQSVKTKRVNKAKSGTGAKDKFHNFNEHGYDYDAIQELLIRQQQG
ncbi:MAG: DnaD domain protein [Lachnospiraceae bacterium]|nr:DnaD domain protein [Lachnospiraceae bacterium]